MLLVLARDQEATAAELTRVLGRDRSAMTRALERLRGQRYVRLTKTEGRRRVHELSPAGWALVRRYLAQSAERGR